MTEPLHLLCVACPAPATALFEVFAAGNTTAVDVCQACGEKLQGEMAAMHEALSDLLRRGVDQRMAERVIAQRVARKELCASIPFNDNDLPLFA